jgi:hypothetical protein
MPRLILIASLVLFSNIVRANDGDPLDELFCAPFEDSPDATLARGQAAPGKAVVNDYEPGPLPNLGRAAHSKSVYNGIYWDGRGNIDLDRGTIAFWYKPNWEIAVSANRKLAGVRTDLEGYWGEVLCSGSIRNRCTFSSSTCRRSDSRKTIRTTRSTNCISRPRRRD